MNRRRAECVIEGCGEVATGRGLCDKHYGHFRYTGEISRFPRVTRNNRLAWLEANASHMGDDCLFWPYEKGGGRGRPGMTITRPDGTKERHLASHQMCRIAHGPPPADRPVAAHSCGNGHLGCLNPRHLSWKTYKENTGDMWVHGTMPLGEKHHHAKLTEEMVREIRRSSVGTAELARRLGVSDTADYHVRRGDRWGHVV